MHITKNVLESLLGTLMNMPEKTKDGTRARKDLEDLKIRKDLHRKKLMEETEEGERGRKVNKKEENYCPPSCFTLSAKEIDQFIKCLMGLKVSLLWEDKQISRPSEAEVQRDEVSRLSRADDADTSSCNPWDHGRARP